MCGLACILRVLEPPQGEEGWGRELPTLEEVIPEDWLDELDLTVSWRGPDGNGRFRDRHVRSDGVIVDVAMLHHRLAIIDPETGHQPMVSTAPPPTIDAQLRRAKTPRGTGTVAVCFNGCVYNHRQLRQELEALGHVFESDHADTEIWIHGWRAWGHEIAARVVGMFAVTLWDGALGELIMFRDRFGEKPLSLSGEPGHLVWLAGSNAAGLRRLVGELGGPTGLSADNTTEWLSLGYHAEQMPFPGVVQLPAGATVSAPTATAIDSKKLYKRGLAGKLPGDWSRSRPRIVTRARTLQHVDRLLHDSVAARLEADVPIGCFLSGGIDSSLIAHHASRALEERGQRLTTVCVRMPEEAYDESERAAETARVLNTHHLTIDAEPNPAEDLLLLIQTLGLPFGDSSLLPTFWACKAAAREVGVALSGDGGDELFLGYERYKGSTWLSAAKTIHQLEFLLPKTDPKSKWSKLARLIEAGKGRGYRDLLAIFPLAELRPLLGLSALSKPGLESDAPESLAKARGYDLRHHLPGDLLRKVDTASMLAGVEVRAPFLDPALAEAALALPTAKVRLNKRPKGLLRALARKHLGGELAGRPKMGFAIPVGTWFRSDFGGLRTLLHDHLNNPDPFPGVPLDIQTKRLQQLLDEHELGRRDHGQRLYALLVLSIWAHAEAG